MDRDEFNRDDAVVAYLRAHAPGLLTPRVDPRTMTSRARDARRRRRFRSSVGFSVAAGTAIAYLALALVGPVPVPGVGSVSVPGSDTVRAIVRGIVPDTIPGPDQWPADVDRLETEVKPLVERLSLSYYLFERGSAWGGGGACQVFEYSRGNYRDGDCPDLVPFDAQARADFDEMTAAVERTGLSIERVTRDRGVILVQLNDSSWQYNWYYAYVPDGATRPETGRPEEQWTHIRGNWWFWRAFDD